VFSIKVKVNTFMMNFNRSSSCIEKQGMNKGN
jgi:hypothetical protein